MSTEPSRRDHALLFVTAPYANQLPLAHFIPTVEPRARLVTVPRPSDVPARLADGSADAALLPVAELARRPDLVAIDGLGVCAAQRARSVLLKCRVPRPDVRTVACDPASLTSNVLARVLFSQLWKQPVRFVAPDDVPTADAAVMIGDPALLAAPSQGGDVDLASAWHALTGLPFVFAVWAHRRGHPDAAELARIVRAAKEAGVAALPELAVRVAADLGLPLDACLDYFTTCIHFDVGPAERAAMQLFGRLIADLASRDEEHRP